MPLTDEERRRYFRIDDTVGITYEIVSEAEAKQWEVEMHQPSHSSHNQLHQVERRLQILIDKLRVQNPEYAEAVELLNIKLNTLKQVQMDELPYHRGPRIKKVNISACGMSFDDRDKISPGQKLYMDITLIPSDLHVYTLAEVIDCHESGDNLEGWTVRVDFYGMSSQDEELMVQHIVKRQGKLLSARLK